MPEAPDGVMHVGFLAEPLLCSAMAHTCHFAVSSHGQLAVGEHQACRTQDRCMSGSLL